MVFFVIEACDSCLLLLVYVLELLSLSFMSFDVLCKGAGWAFISYTYLLLLSVSFKIDKNSMVVYSLKEQESSWNQTGCQAGERFTYIRKHETVERGIREKSIFWRWWKFVEWYFSCELGSESRYQPFIASRITTDIYKINYLRVSGDTSCLFHWFAALNLREWCKMLFISWIDQDVMLAIVKIY